MIEIRIYWYVIYYRGSIYFGKMGKNLFLLVYEEYLIILFFL